MDRQQQIFNRTLSLPPELTPLRSPPLQIIAKEIRNSPPNSGRDYED